MHALIRLIPDYHARVWGGRRLRAAEAPIGEAWIVHEHNRIAAGEDAGRTLAEATAAHGTELLGAAVARRFGMRFPLLIKLLDCNDWLSVQVHPDDTQAADRHGPGHFGKTEAWHILDAQPDAQIVAGVKPGTSADAFARAVRTATVLDVVQMHALHAGDTVFMPAGTVHALGPGLLVYEVQQTSDITYRVWDWGRPAGGGRELHVEPSIAVTDIGNSGSIRRGESARPGVETLIACDYFTLQALEPGAEPLGLDTRLAAFHALTCVRDEVEIATATERMSLGLYETVVVPAAVGRYAVSGRGRLLRSSPLPP